MCVYIKHIKIYIYCILKNRFIFSYISLWLYITLWKQYKDKSINTHKREAKLIDKLHYNESTSVQGFSAHRIAVNSTEGLDLSKYPKAHRHRYFN